MFTAFIFPRISISFTATHPTVPRRRPPPRFPCYLQAPPPLPLHCGRAPPARRLVFTSQRAITGAMGRAGFAARVAQTRVTAESDAAVGEQGGDRGARARDAFGEAGGEHFRRGPDRQPVPAGKPPRAAIARLGPPRAASPHLARAL